MSIRQEIKPSGVASPQDGIDLRFASSSTQRYALSTSFANATMNPLANLEDICRMVLPPDFNLIICRAGFDKDFEPLVRFLGEASTHRDFITEVRQYLRNTEVAAPAGTESPLTNREIEVLAARILEYSEMWGEPCGAWSAAGLNAGVLLVTETFTSRHVPMFCFGHSGSFLAASDLHLNLMRTFMILHESAHLAEHPSLYPAETERSRMENFADAYATAQMLRHSDYDPEVIDFILKWRAVRDLRILTGFSEHAFCGEAVSNVLNITPARLLSMPEFELAACIGQLAARSTPDQALYNSARRLSRLIESHLILEPDGGFKEFPADERLNRIPDMISNPAVGAIFDRAVRAIYSMKFKLPSVLGALVE